MTEGSHLPHDGPAPGATARRIDVVLVTSEGCHFCREADRLLDELGKRFPLTIERVDLTSARGAEIARRWRIPFPPVLLVDGEYHGHGRISERKLTRALTRLVDGRD